MSTETGEPQFHTVEYNAEAGSCVLCNHPIGSTYYRINGHQACAQCAQREQAAQRDSAKNYSRALAFGIGAAVLGMAGYAAFEIATGWIIGYVALAVGWFVGKAMLVGSRGMGGRRYQITAAILTYAAVSLAALPVMFYQVSKEKKVAAGQAQVRQQAQAPEQQAASPQGGSQEGNAAVTVTPNPNDSPEQAVADNSPKMGFGRAVATLFAIGLASPFLELADPLRGLIGLVILFVGIQIAWKMTGRPKLLIDGPF
jgi:hypothetical protein